MALTSNETYIQVRETRLVSAKHPETGEDIQETQATTSIKAEDKVAKLKAESEKSDVYQIEVLKGQTFTYHTAENDADMVELVPNGDLRVEYFNRGYKLAQQVLSKELLEDEDFAPVEGPYDMQEAANTPRERTRAPKDPKSDLLSKLQSGKVSAADVEEILLKFIAASAAK
jgi:hypothetical protein